MSASRAATGSLVTRLQRRGGPCGPPALCLAILLLGLTAPAGAQPGAVSDAAAEAGQATVRHPRANTYMKRRWGIEIVFVRRTSGGYMLEFRYKVVDPVKARPLFDRQSKPMLTHEETGSQFVVPTPAKTGALRNSNPPIQDRVYWMFFANPAKYVEKGDLVTIRIGNFVADGLVVE